MTETSIFRISAPAGLLQRILRRVELEKIHQAIRRSLLFWYSLTFVFIVSLGVAGFFFYTEAMQSGLVSYLGQLWALIGVSPSLVVAHWNDILTSVGEALPVLGLTILIATVGIVIWSTDKIVGFSRKWRTVRTAQI